jgi:RimJ/RimL family protein N-acetyltransferase
MFFIETERLKLLPLSHEQLQLCHADRNAFERSIGLQPSRMLVDAEYENEVKDAMEHFWLPKTLANPLQSEWFTSWEIILKSINTTIGGIGFLGYPNEDGETEIGFMIDQQYHRMGYALEAIAGMIAWAYRDKNTKYILAQTVPENLASRQLLIKAGFTFVCTVADRAMFKYTRVNAAQ